MKTMTLKKGLGLIVLASALTSSPIYASDKDTQLESQTQRFWSAQAKRDWNGVYDLLNPKDQATITRTQYSELRNKSGIYDSSNAKIISTEVVDDIAWVSIMFEAKIARIPNAPPRLIHTWQLWQKTDTWHPVSDVDRQKYQTLPPKLRLAEEETALATRAKAAWESKTAQDYKRFYSFLSPDYRAVVSLDNFLKKKAQYLYPSTHIDWTEVSQAKKDAGLVKITFTMKPSDPAAVKLEAQEKTLVENWTKQKGDWYFDIPLPEGTQQPATAAPSKAKP